MKLVLELLEVLVETPVKVSKLRNEFNHSLFMKIVQLVEWKRLDPMKKPIKLGNLAT